jgi:trans-aconitate methyltransferase
MSYSSGSSGFDPAAPSSARMINYATGGKDNFEVDRKLANEIMELSPDAKTVAAHNRDFLSRAVAHVARERVRQFIDIGCGLPAESGSTHEIALAADSAARCAYVDRDPLVLAHLRALVESPPQVTAVHGDLYQPGDMLASPALNRCINFSQPVCVVLGAVLHLLETPAAFQVVDHITRALPRGSFLVLSHATADDAEESVAREVQDKYARQVTPLTLRTRAEVTKFFNNFELLEPGVVNVTEWRNPKKVEARAILYGGVGRTP